MSQGFDLPGRPVPIGQRDTATRSEFITRTYNHLMAAIVGFTLFEVWLFTSGLAETIASVLLGGSWLLVLGAFIVVGWVATRVAHSSENIGAQYAALAGFVVAEGIIFVPMLYIANTSFPGVIQNAAFVTLAGFAGLTAVAFVTRKDFSFLRGILMFGGILALVAIVSAVLFGFDLGTWFSVAMIGLAGASILYDTSAILRDYPEDRYVGAALQLFASVAMMFWYVLRLFMASRD
ncbi:MAG: permease [bacterium]|nr:permease [bacterium]